MKIKFIALLYKRCNAKDRCSDGVWCTECFMDIVSRAQIAWFTECLVLRWWTDFLVDKVSGTQTVWCMEWRASHCTSFVFYLLPPQCTAVQIFIQVAHSSAPKLVHWVQRKIAVDFKGRNCIIRARLSMFCFFHLFALEGLRGYTI